MGLFVEDKIMAEGEKFYHIKLDTRAVTGQDELTVSARHTPGKELKIETNLPEFRTMKVTSAGPAKTFWFNGEEKATLTIDLAWPKMTADASDLEFGVTITPNRKVVTKF